MSIFIANIDNDGMCKLYDEDGTGLVQSIYDAYQHISAIELYIKDNLDHHYIRDGLLNVYITGQQLLKLSLRVSEEEDLRADYGEDMQEAFSELYTIIEELLGD